MSEHLALYRAKIDQIDAQINKLLEERFRITQQIGQYKKEQGLPIFDQERERRMQVKHRQQLAKTQYEQSIAAIWQTILTESKQQQTNTQDETQ